MTEKIFEAIRTKLFLNRSQKRIRTIGKLQSKLVQFKNRK